MSKSTRYLGLDVHAQTITAAIAEGRKKVRNLGQLPNRPEAVTKLIEKLGGASGLKVCYEAGPTGYALYWQLTGMGVECEAIAPSLIPRKSGERIKTDRRDAEKLAQCYQAGTLTAVWVPDAAHEALRDLVRARAAAKKDESRAKHRLVKYLLRHGLQHPQNCRAWTHPWWRWVQSLQFEFETQQVTLGDCVAEVLHMAERVARLDVSIDRAIESAAPEKRAVIEALQALRGVAKLTAVTIMTEVGTFQRFRKHGKENPRIRCAVPNPRCLVRGSSRRMKDCEVRLPDQSSNISLMTVDNARPGPFTLRFIQGENAHDQKTHHPTSNDLKKTVDEVVPYQRFGVLPRGLSVSDGLVGSNAVLASPLCTFHPVEGTATEMHEGENKDAALKDLVCNAVVTESRQEISLNRRNHPFGTWPGGPHAWTLDNRLKRGLNFSDEVVAESRGALLVPIGRLDDLVPSVRVYDELHDASEVPS